MKDFLNRLWALLRRAALDADVAEQMRIHIEMETEANLRAGMSAAEAARAARLSFGSEDRFRAEARDARRFGAFEDVVHDSRFALRALRHEPSFTVAALLALGLGVGVTTAIFSLLDSVLLRPVPGVSAPEELVQIHMQRGALEDGSWTGISHANFVDLARAVPALAGLTGYQITTLHALPESGAPEVIVGSTVVGDYFDVLGVKPARGRFFTGDELGPGSHWQVAVISHALWQRMFAGALDVIGRTLRVNENEFTVIGVTPQEFRGPERLESTDAWLPPASYDALRHFTTPGFTERRPGYFRELIGRVAPDGTPELVQEQMRAAMARLTEQYPEENGIYTKYIPTVYGGFGTPAFERSYIEQTARLLGVVGLLVLLIACANVANLVLFRAVRRRGELAVRRAIGADSIRLLRQNLVEGIVLAGAGSAAGIALAFGLVVLLRRATFSAWPPLVDLAVNYRMLGFALALALVTGLLFGAVGAFAHRASLSGRLKETARVGGAGARGTFMVVQVACCVVLLTGAALLLRTLKNLQSVDVGMNTAGVVMGLLSLEPQGYDSTRKELFIAQLLERMDAHPQIHDAAITVGVPLVFPTMLSGLKLPEAAPDAAHGHYLFHGSAALFTTLRLRLEQGRNFTRDEANGPRRAGLRPIILSHTSARALFGEAAAVGRRLAGPRDSDPQYEVIGVVSDVPQNVRKPIEAAAYLPLSESLIRLSYQVLFKTPLRPAEAEATLREIVASLDPTLPLSRVGMLDDAVNAKLTNERMLTAILTALALLAALLSAVGVYGITAYAVAQRRREIGIRAALGARPLQIVQFVSRHATIAVMVGGIIGVGAATVASRLIESALFGVERLQPTIYVIGVLAFVPIAALAAALPARAATTVDPLEALRAE